MLRERRTLWWSEKPDLWTEVVAWVVSVVLWGSWMAKWSMDDTAGWQTGLKEGGRWCVRHVKLCRRDWRMRPLVDVVCHCV